MVFYWRGDLSGTRGALSGTTPIDLQIYRAEMAELPADARRTAQKGLSLRGRSKCAKVGRPSGPDQKPLRFGGAHMSKGTPGGEYGGITRARTFEAEFLAFVARRESHQRGQSCDK